MTSDHTRPRSREEWDAFMLHEYEELRAKFGSGEGPWVDGTPEGDYLWKLQHTWWGRIYLAYRGVLYRWGLTR